MNRSAFHLGVFAKYWEPGKVKTRLAPVIGVEGAASVYRSFLVCLLHRMRHAGDSREVTYAPDNASEAFETLACPVVDDWQLHPQGIGDLGARMERFFERNLGRPTLLIGSDSPTLPVHYLQEAATLLASYPIVLGPSEDGGYYLIGVNGPLPPVFSGIDWSTGQVWQQTVARLKATALPYAVLPTWYDIDSNEDLRRLLTELEQEVGTSSQLDQLREELTDVLTRG